MAWTRRPRTSHPGMGRLVQPPKDLPRPRPHPTRRIREAPLPSNRVRPSGRDSHDRACMKPGEVHSAFLVGLVSVAQFVPQLVLAPLSGSIADRGNRLIQAVVGRFLVAAGSGVLGLWVWLSA